MADLFALQGSNGRTLRAGLSPVSEVEMWNGLLLGKAAAKLLGTVHDASRGIRKPGVKNNKEGFPKVSKAE